MIFYFSGTGNTRWAAEAVARALGEPLIAIADAADGDCHYSLSVSSLAFLCNAEGVLPLIGWLTLHSIGVSCPKISSAAL